MTSTYEEFLISYEDWSHDKSSSTDMTATDFYYQSCIKDVITCSKCNIALTEWESNDNSLKKHSRYATCAWVEEQIVKKSSSARLEFQTKIKSSHEERLIIFKKWSHTSSISESLVVVEFYHESDTKNLTTCSECDLKLSNWKLKRDLMKAHIRQSSNCWLTHSLNENETSVAIATSTKSNFELDI